MTRTSSFSPYLFLLATTAAACGGAAEAGAPANKSPDSTMREQAPPREEPEPTTVEEAQAQIARLNANLQSQHDKKAESKAASPASPESPVAPTPQGGSTSTTPNANAGAGAGPADACGNPCRALMSMKRAVDALCRMTSESDNRCVDGKKTLNESATRVLPCKCSN